MSNDILVEYERNGETFQEWVSVDGALSLYSTCDNVREATPTQDQIDNKRNTPWKITTGVDLARTHVAEAAKDMEVKDPELVETHVTETSTIVHLMARSCEMRGSTVFDILDNTTGNHIASFDCKTNDEVKLSHMRLALIKLLSKFGVCVLIKQEVGRVKDVES